MPLEYVGGKSVSGDVATQGDILAATLVTTLPGSPTNGQTCVINPAGWGIFGTAEVQADVQWLMRYNSTTTKWHYIGGNPLITKVDTQENRAVAASYANLTTTGPGVTLVIAGDYIIQVGTRLGSLASFGGYMSYDVGGVAAVDADAVFASVGAIALFVSGESIPRRKTVAANTNVLSKYKATTNAVTFTNRWMSVLPIRLG